MQWILVYLNTSYSLHSPMMDAWKEDLRTKNMMLSTMRPSGQQWWTVTGRRATNRWPPSQKPAELATSTNNFRML